MIQKQLPRVLFVDDEKNVLDSLALTLRHDYDVHTATGGQAALALLEAGTEFTVVCSDMRMPGMSGAELLNKVVRLYPEATRMLLTGEPGRDGVIDAVNDGQIFRFLTKPCNPAKLKAALSAAVIQHRLVVAERVLLQDTLVGCIKALVDVLAITNPVAFGRTDRVRRLAMDLAKQFNHTKFWQLDAAAMLSQIGYLSLPVELVEKLYYGEPLTPEEKTLSEGVPAVAGKLLGHIPRIEAVLQILTALNTPNKPVQGTGPAAIGARILNLVLEYDSSITRGITVDTAIAALRKSPAKHEVELIDKLAETVGARSGGAELRTLPLGQVMAGMTFVDELRSDKGILLVPAGFEVTDSLSERLRNYSPVLRATQVRLMVKAESAAKAQNVA
jgi:CheY-like chemotaxis protein